MSQTSLKILNRMSHMTSWCRLHMNQSTLVTNQRRILSSQSPQATAFDLENRNILQIKERGLVVGIFPDKVDLFEKFLSSEYQTCYCGFDPTASSLHIGNLLALITLIHCQRRGHKPLVVIGSATALIGDPSGKTADRNLLELTEVASNSSNIQNLVNRIFHNHENFIWNRTHTSKLPKLTVKNNIEWYEHMNVIKFMSQFGRYLRMGDLLSRKQMETRLKSKEGINYAEFSYQAFQAYDWYYLLDNHNCTIQIGGNDQTGNIKSGHELISKLKPNKRVFGFTLPIITSEKGDKLGKTAGNAVWLDPNLFSPFEFYQFFYNTSDQMVETYLKLFTFLPLNEINDIMDKHKASPEKFHAQRKLTSELTLLVHGAEGLESALKCTNAFFFGDRESLAKLTESEVASTFKGCSTTMLPMEAGLTVLECALKAKCFKNVDDAVNVIKSGGFKINSLRCNNPQEVLVYGQHILLNNLTIIRVVGCGYLLNRFYFNGPMCRSKKRLDGKVVCITGANCGIGYETALDLANRGATVILACRDLNKAYKAQHQILIATKNPNVFAEKLDLASLASIKDFADMFANRYKQLHILINNAETASLKGLLSVQREKTVDGFELNFGVMHLGHFYLTNLLLDLMKSSAPARIINVSSVGHIGVNMQWDDLQLINCKYDALYFYRHAKLANVLFTVELAERLKDSNITAVSLHPGGVHTDIFRQVRQGNINLWSIVYLLITPVFWVTGKDCKHGAQTSIHCAVDDNVPSQNGKYFDNCKVGYCSWQSRDAQAAKRLWDISAKLVGLK